MAKVLYIDAIAGLAGDMLAGALLDLGWPFDELRGLVQRMGLEGVTLESAPVMQKSIAARRLEVKVEHDQPHRHLPQVLEIMGRLPQEIAEPAGRVFQRLAEAEAKVHGTTPDKIHFHEVGAADALVDVAAFCAGLAWLGQPRVVCSPLPLGRGFVDCAHGRIPLPAPAVVNLLEGLPVTSWPEQAETVTPTGAALVSTLAAEFGEMPAMAVTSSGFGAGTRPGGHAPNVVRLVLGEQGKGQKHPHFGHGDVVEIVCNLDDMNPEDLPLAMERLLAAGALDAYAAPIYMKKGRPGLEFTVLAPPEKARDLAGMVLEQTSSLGVRLRHTGRRTLEREVISVQSPWGEVRVKKAKLGDTFRHTPEADDVLRICRETGLTPFDVRQKLAKLLD